MQEVESAVSTTSNLDSRNGNAEKQSLELRSWRSRLARKALRLLVVVHRWIGIFACLLFVIWFVSGLVLMYVHFPAMSPEEKLATIPPIEWNEIRAQPEEALEAASFTEFPKKFWLEMSAGEPVYRLHDWDDADYAVSAVSGQRISQVEPIEALRTVQLNLAAPSATLLIADLESDQWTVAGYWDELRPFHVIALNDSLDTHYYVSVETGEIVLDTVRWERFWNYLGAIPHWIYFEFIRFDTDLWFWVVVVLSAIGIVAAVSGLLVGITRLRLRHRHDGSGVSPFLSWTKWHHIAGIIGGVFLLAWIVTGLLSLYPSGFLEQRDVTGDELRRYAGNTLPRFAFSGLNSVANGKRNVRSAEFIWLGGRPLVLLRDGESNVSIVDSLHGAAQSIADDELYSTAKNLMPDSTLISSARLVVGDEYWHTGFTVKKLPILRVAFDDEANTWFFIDPDSGQVVGILDDVGRLDRWANSGLHGMDLAFLRGNRPLWDIIVWVLMLAGLFISLSGVVIGVKRLIFTSKSSRKRRSTARLSEASV